VGQFSDVPRRPVPVRERLIRAASVLLSQRPPGAVSTRHIADLAGVQQSLIFRHFGSKEQLVREVAIRYAGAYFDAITSTGDPVESFHRALDFMLSPEGKASLVALTMVRGEGSEIWPASKPGLNAHAAQIRRARKTRRGTAPADERDPIMVAAVTIALIAGWSFLENWALEAAELSSLGVETVRAQLHEMIDAFVRKEAGLPPDTSSRLG
jgi:AcrR family transcriptional regulator